MIADAPGADWLDSTDVENMRAVLSHNARLADDLKACKQMLAAVVLQAGGTVKVEASTMMNMRPDTKMVTWSEPRDNSWSIVVSNPAVKP